MSGRKLLLAVVVSTLSGCVSTSAGDSLAPADVTANPTAWEAATIRVSGRLAFGSHERCVCRESRGSNDSGNCLTLVDTYPLRAKLTRLHGRWVTVIGSVVPDTWTSVEGGDIVDFGSCGQVGLRVEAVE